MSRLVPKIHPPVSRTTCEAPASWEVSSIVPIEPSVASTP